MTLRRLCASFCVAAALVALSSAAKSDDLLNSANPGSTLLSCPDCNCGYGCDDGACCGGGHRSAFYVQADVLYWDRVGNGCDQVVVLDTSLPAGADTVLTTEDFDFDFEPGIRVLVGYVPDPCLCPHCSAWEATYFGVFDWDDSLVATGAGSLAIPGDLGLVSNNFSGADEIRLLYDSELHSVELNCVHCCCQCWGTIDFLAGVRFISLEEDLSIVGTDLQEGTSSYDIETSNDLYGFQMGGRLRRHYCRWTLELLGKAGVFYNDSEQSQVVTDSPFVGAPFVLRSPRTTDEGTVAGLGEMGMTLIRPLGDVWSFRIGYNALTLGGVALATEQLDFTNTLSSGTRLNDEGWIFVHGAHIGLEACW
jgi:hypothetical protein